MNRQRDALLSLATMVVLGVLAGVVWSRLADPVVATRTAQGIASGESELVKQVTADGWFSALGFLGSLIVGLALTLRRRADEVVTLIGLAGSSLLGAWLCLQVGSLLGPDPATETLAKAAIGSTAVDQLSVHTWVVYLTWPFGAVIGSLLALLGRRGSGRERPGPVVQWSGRRSGGGG